jgi:aryl-alcohol dehydrogenase-like predicted oxidoreductase
MRMIRMKTLGRTGLKVSQISLGGLFVSKMGADFQQARTATLRALELGINYIDTAPGYADSEEVLGKIIKDVKTPLILSTKLGGRPEPFQPKDRDCLMRSVETSLKLLHRDHLDMLMIHEPDRPRQYDWWNDFKNAEGPVWDLLCDLKKSGVIRHTGLGGTTAYGLAQLCRTGKFDVVLTAFNYSLLWREAEHEVLPAARKQKMGIIIGSPLQQGALAARYDEQIRKGAEWMSKPRREQFRALYALLDEIKMPIHEAGLRFAISNPAVSCVLTGSRSVAEVEANVAAAAKGPLPKPILKKLDAIAAMVPFRPYEEPFSLPFRRVYKGPGNAWNG